MDKKQWNQFIKENGPKSGSFLQSFEWGEFQQSLGRKVIRILSPFGRSPEGGENGFAAQIIKIPFCCGLSYFYIPKGPIFKKNQEYRIKNYESRIKTLIETAKKEKAIFIRFEPEALDENEIKNLNLRPSPASQIQPKRTLILDLEKSFDDLLRGMHPKTRYNIHLAERFGAETKMENKFGDFLHLLKETSERDKFHLHPDSYYKKMLENLTASNDFQVKLWVAKHRGQIIAADLIGYFGKTATYLHGASSHNYRNLMAPHLLHWTIIKDAKSNGYKYYDFWGIDEAKWPGVTRFKKGFGGEEISSPGTFDLPIKKNLYKMYQLARKVRSIF
jgi:peptidoglycan pentaglycine glycine transferase (the first glycine)